MQHHATYERDSFHVMEADFLDREHRVIGHDLGGLPRHRRARHRKGVLVHDGEASSGSTTIRSKDTARDAMVARVLELRAEYPGRPWKMDTVVRSVAAEFGVKDKRTVYRALKAHRKGGPVHIHIPGSVTFGPMTPTC